MLVISIVLVESERIHAGDIKLLFRSLTKSILEAENDAEISVYELFKRIEKSPLHVGQFSTHIWQWNNLLSYTKSNTGKIY